MERVLSRRETLGAKYMPGRRSVTITFGANDGLWQLEEDTAHQLRLVALAVNSSANGYDQGRSDRFGRGHATEGRSARGTSS